MKVNLLSEHLKHHKNRMIMMMIGMVMITLSIFSIFFVSGKNNHHQNSPKSHMQLKSLSKVVDKNVVFPRKLLNELDMVGVMKWHGKYSALLKSKKGVVKEIIEGDQVGQMAYQVRRISQTGILLSKNSKSIHLSLESVYEK